MNLSKKYNLRERLNDQKTQELDELDDISISNIDNNNMSMESDSDDEKDETETRDDSSNDDDSLDKEINRRVNILMKEKMEKSWLPALHLRVPEWKSKLTHQDCRSTEK